jgi:hypothetical protein
MGRMGIRLGIMGTNGRAGAVLGHTYKSDCI